MNNPTTNPTEHTTTSLLNPFNLIAGLASDLIEVAKSTYQEITEIPDAMADGWKNGAMVNTDESMENSVQPTEVTAHDKIDDAPAQTTAAQTVADIEKEIARLQAFKASMEEPTEYAAAS